MSEESKKIKLERATAIENFAKNKTLTNRLNVRRIKKRLKRAYKRDKTKFYNNICKEIANANNVHDTTKMSNGIRFLTGKYTKKPLQLKDKNGEVVSNTKAMLRVLKEYFFNLLNANNKNLIDNLDLPEDLPIITEKFTMKELTDAIKHLKKRKSAQE